MITRAILNRKTIPRQFLAHTPLNRDDGGLLLDAYLHLVRKKKAASGHIKGPLVSAFRSPLMKALDRSVETLGL